MIVSGTLVSTVRALAPLLALCFALSASAASAPPTVVLDPGHDLHANLATEAIGPGSETRKIKDGGGTSGIVTRTPEAIVNLAISLRTAMLLRRAGVRVVLTRTRTRGVSMGNIARARIANSVHAALFLRVHADGSPNRGIRGTSVLYPAFRRGWTDDIARPSRRAARIVLRELVRTLGSRDRGLQRRSDMTGFNWADVPAILVEVGYLSNPAEDRRLVSATYQRRAALGLCRGTLRFLGRAPRLCQ
jgi:N-acetylmuramoyl-L-alanine amidase